ncbi:MAG: hypothetical protein RQ761_04940 [Bacteroidales bacterium]|nr:hypothetical protein [Bacteroidales bacterium]
MKKIRTFSVMLAMMLAILLITSCGSPEDNLPGNWVTESVEATVDSTKASAANLASVDMAIASAKTTTFTLNDDHTMVLTIDGYRSDAFWAYNSENNMITFMFEEGDVGDPIELGRLDGNKILYTSSVKNGNITSVYVKE